MNKIIEWVKNQDNTLMATAILFIVGVLVALLGTLSIVVTSHPAFIAFGVLVITMGIIIVVFGFVALCVFIGQL